jgi:hypothetical protein
MNIIGVRLNIFSNQPNQTFNIKVAKFLAVKISTALPRSLYIRAI